LCEGDGGHLFGGLVEHFYFQDLSPLFVGVKPSFVDVAGQCEDDEDQEEDAVEDDQQQGGSYLEETGYDNWDGGYQDDTARPTVLKNPNFSPNGGWSPRRGVWSEKCIDNLNDGQTYHCSTQL